MIYANYVKAASEVLDYTIDWSSWLAAGDTINTSAWAVAPTGELTLAAGSNTTTTTKIRASAGVAGKAYTLTNTITTTGGLTGVREIAVSVNPRAGMALLLRELRALANANADDVTVGGETFWSDEQLQARLDRYRVEFKSLDLQEVARLNDAGQYEYYEYKIPERAGRWFEGAESGAEAWQVRRTTGFPVATTSYGVNYPARMIVFTANQSGYQFVLDCRSYDLFATAADIWEEKAGQAAAAVDWQSDNHRVSASQNMAHCYKMAKQLRAKSWQGARASTFFRTDEVY